MVTFCPVDLLSLLKGDDDARQVRANGHLLQEIYQG